MVYFDANGNHILYKTYENGTWSDSIRVDASDDTVQVMRPNISIDPNYGIYVTWVQETSKNKDGKRIYNVFYATSPDGGATWNDPVQLSNTTYMNDNFYSVKNPTIGKKVQKEIPGVFDGGAEVVWTEASQNSKLGYYLMYARIPYVGTLSAVNDNKIKPYEFSLEQNYPNPFNPSTVIKFTLPKKEFATLKVYDVLGKEVATLVKGKMSAGQHRVNFSAKNLAAGVYIYKLTAGNRMISKKMVLLK